MCSKNKKIDFNNDSVKIIMNEFDCQMYALLKIFSDFSGNIVLVQYFGTRYK